MGLTAFSLCLCLLGAQGFANYPDYKNDAGTDAGVILIVIFLVSLSYIYLFLHLIHFLNSTAPPDAPGKDMHPRTIHRLLSPVWE